MSGIAVDRTDWSFWVRAATWTAEEATLILVGIVPSILRDEYEDWSGHKQTVSMIEVHGAENFFELVTRKFPDGKVEPLKFFEWVNENGFHLKDSLLVSAESVLSLSRLARDLKPRAIDQRASDGRGGNSAKVRYSILCASLKFLSQLDKDEFAEYLRPSGGLNVAKLSEAIHDERDKFPVLATESYGTAVKNIAATLADAMSESPRKLPK